MSYNFSIRMKIDGRSFDRRTLETLRVMGVKRIREEGETIASVVKSFGITRMAVYKWLKIYDDHGYDGLKIKKSIGRPPTLTAKQKCLLRQMIVGKKPTQYGFDFGFWSRKIVCELVSKQFDHTISVTTAGKLLAELEITPQRPLYRAHQQNPELITKWKEKIFPKIKKKAKRIGAEIFFLDESGFRTDATYGRTWGARGETPVITRSFSRQRVNAISIISQSGAFWYDVYKGKFDTAKFLDVLKSFLKYRRKKIFLVLDNLSVHKSVIIRKYIEENSKKIEFYFLPSYSPELNPDEFVWSYVKENGISKKPLKEGDSLFERVERDLIDVMIDKKLVRSLFTSSSVNYICD